MKVMTDGQMVNLYIFLFQIAVCTQYFIMRGSRVGDMMSGTPLKNHKSVGFLSNTGPDPLKNDKATEPVFNFGPSSTRQRNAI